MDTPRKWQIASVATAVASMSIGGVMLARPTNEAVASIDLELVTDSRELNLASPGSSTTPADGSSDAPQIVSPEAIEGPVPSPAPSATSVDSPDAATTDGSTGTGTTSGTGTISGQTEPTQPPPATPLPDSLSSDSASSVDSPSSIDS